VTETNDGSAVIQVPKVLVDDVREIISDDDASNELIEGREFSDQFLAKCVVYILRDFNATSPASLTLTFAQLFGAHGDLRTWVVEAAAGRALYLGGLRRMRNQAPYQAGSISFDPNATGAALMQTGERMMAMWDKRKKDKKVEINVSNGFHVAHSELAAREILTGSTIVVAGGPL